MKETGPKVCVLKTDGINCDLETISAFTQAGARAELVHINELRAKEKYLTDYQILTIPGGFSYGDDLRAGKILAVELNSYLADQITDFVHGRNGLVLGICNGFQVLIRAGILPFGSLGYMQATLERNTSGKFECRWINLRTEANSTCAFLNVESFTLTLPVAHGEGRFSASEEVMQKLKANGQIAMRYCDTNGNPTMKYPENPNGSDFAIAAISDPTGRIVGSMPHPERAVVRTQFENWRRQPTQLEQPQIIKRMVIYAAQS